MCGEVADMTLCQMSPYLKHTPVSPQTDFLDVGHVQRLTVLLNWAVFWLMINIVTDVPDSGSVLAM